ncbi:MAG: Rrf2 family transcriptional regulator [Deltaproteobacteria bacterium]|nr:Rrf2 family transcriptional regulator [Deltaproteobacteria bacterium]
MSQVPFPELPLSARYALSALLAVSQADGPLSAPTLAKSIDVPKAFLSKVLAQLVSAGLMTGTRGRGGGFRIAVPTQEIPLARVLAAVIDQGTEPKVCAMRDTLCSDGDPCPLHDRWSVASAPLKQLLATVTIADLEAK